MPTFAELQSELKKLQHRKAILTHLQEYLDDKFLPAAGAEPKSRLLDDNGQPVPESAFESLQDNLFSDELQQTEQEIQKILTTTIGPTVVASKKTEEKKT